LKDEPEDEEVEQMEVNEESSEHQEE